MESLVAHGHVTRGYLGVMIQKRHARAGAGVQLKNQCGALIGDVVDDGPAAQAGFKPGDVVLEFNGKQSPTSHLQLQWPGPNPVRKCRRDSS